MSKITWTSLELDVTRRALLAEARNLENQYRTALDLSEPCTPGHWRWADVKLSGYGRKPEAELQAMYAQNKAKLPGLAAELKAVQGALAAMEALAAIPGGSR